MSPPQRVPEPHGLPLSAAAEARHSPACAASAALNAPAPVCTLPAPDPFESVDHANQWPQRTETVASPGALRNESPDAVIEPLLWDSKHLLSDLEMPFANLEHALTIMARLGEPCSMEISREFIRGLVYYRLTLGPTTAVAPLPDMALRAGYRGLQRDWPELCGRVNAMVLSDSMRNTPPIPRSNRKRF